MIALWVIALTVWTVYLILARCAPDLATDLGAVFALVIAGAWVALSHLERNR